MRGLGQRFPGGPATGARPASGTLGPATERQREPILDAVRGFALLGILLVNIELMRGADLYRLFAGGNVEDAGAADGATQFLVGWLVEGKFLSSFAILFGVGAALMTGRASRAAYPPRLLLLRRYGVLALFGLGHMVLLFPGDILFAYGVAGMLLLPFVGVRARTALWWAAGILGVLLVLGVGVTVASGLASDGPADDPLAAAVEDFVAERQEQAVAARQEGTYVDVIAANVGESVLVQASTISVLPWIVALFLVGFAVGRSGLLGDLAAHRHRLRTAMITGLAVGLPLNLPSGLLRRPVVGPGAPIGAGVDVVEVLATVGQTIGAPVLAVGYLSAVALLCLRVGASRPLAAAGRMALTGYLLQSVLAAVVFVGLGLYDRVTPAQSLLVVVAVWALLLVVCPLWLRHFRFGPVEWLWRTLTYGQRQPLRRR